MIPALPPAQNIFLRAQTVWNERAAAPFESFTLPCESTLFAKRCAPGANVAFVVRLADGRAYAHTIAQSSRPAMVLMRGGFIAGPAGAPLGFYRRVPVPGQTPPASPPNLAPDPLQTIATVAAVDRAYDVRLVAIENIGNRPAYHLTLRPLRDSELYPLRELMVDTANDRIVRLTYAQPFNGTTATVHYDFAAAGSQGIWTIVHIDAEATTRSLFTSKVQRVSEDLHDIAFPKSEPPEDFQP
jgi:hypothetical protein